MNHKKILKAIKKYNNIIIARHVGADPDALGSSVGLKEIIKYNFPNKNVYIVGNSSSRFKYFGAMDKNVKTDESLLIVTDTPDRKRVDGVNPDDFEFKIKIDHHPFIEKFCDIEYIDDTASSASQMIIEFAFKSNLKIPKSAAEKLFMGLVSDTNRFLFYYTTPDTMRIVSKIIDDTKIDFTSLYDDLYARPLAEVRLQGYMAENMIVTENGFAYIKLTDEVIRSFNADPASSGNLVNSFNNINEVLVWVTFSEDIKQKQIRVNARSRGPVINKTLEKYNGGGHKFSSGAKLKSFEEADALIKDLDELCKNYKKEN